LGKNIRKRWTREETILAFNLYCKLPFTKISKNNIEIIELSNLIGRTPSSVAFKLANLASFDPELQKRKISGLTHTSKLDSEIWVQFSNNLEELAYQTQIILSKFNNNFITEIDLKEIKLIPEGLYKESLIRTRIGQTFFRKTVLNSYRNKCCITGLNNPKLLIASHIKPWKDSDEKNERTNPSNGLSLNPFHDKAFDSGLITINKEFQVIISSKLIDTKMDNETINWLKSYNKKKILLPDKFFPGESFIEYHNDVVFKN